MISENLTASVPKSVIAERDIYAQVERYLHMMFGYLPEPNRSMVAHLIGDGVMNVVKNGLSPRGEYEQKLYKLDTEL